ncbi:unnamed protein product [Kuraishia capsulata CBS 1993]|uniref:RRM domain-containing protein n=1 Tax=Kuraishia capsulata CBS 1993 TaxID=1382522 RepID=W6MWG4_9ASCO|nr:uncharacterized protein KUCA_T00003378001 [Kuraishia capsulata CBS 1993]CDK27400.1 unnamed protein product [Kuraishia capsulata CBS 1993]
MLPYGSQYPHYSNGPSPYQSQQDLHQAYGQIPQTPFDYQYGQSMLPRQLLMGSPFIQNSMPPQSPVRSGMPPNARRRSHSSQLNSPLIPPKLGNPKRSSSGFSNPPIHALKSLSVASSTTSLNDMYQNGKQQIPNSYNLKNSRTLLFQDLPETISLQQFLDSIRFGPVENCYFKDNEIDSNEVSIVLSFVDNQTAYMCYESITDNHVLAINLNAPNLKISWMLSPTMLPVVKTAIENDSATRNVYISNIPPSITEEMLISELEVFGYVESLHYHDDRNVAFAHFTSIASAIKAVEQLALDSNILSNCKVFYGSDRCISRESLDTFDSFQYQQHQELAHHRQQQHLHQQYSGFNAAAAVAASAGSSNIGNRTVYLGNLHPNTTVEEICNVVRGGLLQSVKFISDKHICFITFIDSSSSAQFFATSNMDGLMVHGRKLKIGWGRHSGALPNSVMLAVTGGASRNVYIGVVDEEAANKPDAGQTVSAGNAGSKVPDVDVLRRDFSVFGEIEQINFFKEGACAFVNFLNISSAIKAVDEFNGKNRKDVHANFDGRYLDYKISFGKDRCGNPAKQRKSKTKKAKGKTINEDNKPEDGSSDDLAKEQDTQSKDISPAPSDVSGSSKGDVGTTTSTPNTTAHTSETDAVAFAGIGIVSKASEKDPVAKKDVVSVDLKPEEVEETQEEIFQVENGLLPGQLRDADSYDSDSEESGSISIIVDKDPNSPEVRADSPLSVTVPPRQWKSANGQSNGNGTGNVAPINRHNSSNSSSFISKNYNSSRSSSNGSMNLYQLPYGNSQENFYKRQQPPQSLQHVPPIQHMQQVPQSVYYPGYQINTYLKQPRTAAYMPKPAQSQRLNGHSSHFGNGAVMGGVSSGSQVMAQYLAQAQHENLLYAAAVLNAEEEYGMSGDEYYFEEPDYKYMNGYYKSPPIIDLPSPTARLSSKSKKR